MKKTVGIALALLLLTTGAFAAQPPNTFFAGPCGGSVSKTPGFRILCASDLAALAPTYGGISLQESTPGTANTGNGHITGTFIVDTGFIGPLTGDVTGNASGNAGTVTNGVYTTTLPTLADSVLSSTASVNLNSGTAATLYTCPSGKTCVVTAVVIKAASTSLTTWSGSFGWNSTSFNDVIANATHTELTGATLYTRLSAKAGAALGTSTGVFKTLANTLQGGAATATIDVIGYVY